MRLKAFQKIPRALAQHMERRGELNLETSYIDGTFSSAKKGAKVGKTKLGKSTKILAISEESSLPVAIHIALASPHEVTLVRATPEGRFTRTVPRTLVGGRAYDSDLLDAELRLHRVTLIAPHQGNRRKPKTQDGRSLRRYRKRWKVERLNTWLQNYRRIVTGYERNPENFLGFVHLACMRMLLKNYF